MDASGLGCLRPLSSAVRKFARYLLDNYGRAMPNFSGETGTKSLSYSAHPISEAVLLCRALDSFWIVVSAKYDERFAVRRM